MKIKYIEAQLYGDEGLQKATEGSAAYDLKAKTTRYMFPGEVYTMGLGIALDMRGSGMSAIVLPRSGLGSKGLILGNSVGLIDEDYVNEIRITLWNRSEAGMQVARGDRIAQLMFVPVAQVQLERVTQFEPGKSHGAGFGSTGK